MSEPELDLRRFTPEAKRAIEAQACVLIEQLTPGLRARFEPQHVVLVSGEGQDLARLPLYRLHAPDPERLRKCASRALEAVDDPALADRLVNAINAGAIVVYAPPDQDWLDVSVDGIALFAAHRRVVVPAWPDDED